MTTALSKCVSERIDLANAYSASKLLMCLGVLALCFVLRAEDVNYCSFEVKVRTPSGSPVVNVPVAMIKRHTVAISETKTTENGLARLCDAPLEPVDIVVGYDLCGSVLVRNVRPTWPITHRIFVTYVETWCAHVTPESNCPVLLRVQDDKGKPISGARLKETPIRVTVPEKTDVFGRLLRNLKQGEKIEGAIVKEGWVPLSIIVNCGPLGGDELEKVLILRKQ